MMKDTVAARANSEQSMLSKDAAYSWQSPDVPKPAEIKVPHNVSQITMITTHPGARPWGCSW